MSEKHDSKSFFVVKKILKALFFLSTFFVFMPSFLVSCSSQTIEVRLMDAVGGVEMLGEKIDNPHPFLLVCLLIPVAMLVLLFIKKYSDNLKAKVIAAATALDVIIWFLFRSNAKKIALENYCTFKTTGWYVANIISLLLIFGLSVLVVLKILDMESDLLAMVTGNNTNKSLKDISNRLAVIVDNVQTKVNSNSNGYCVQCGKPLGKGDAFCTHCGAKVIKNEDTQVDTNNTSTSTGAIENPIEDSKEKNNINEDNKTQ